jgi:soluble lytic murein transglycosylase
VKFGFVLIISATSAWLAFEGTSVHASQDAAADFRAALHNFQSKQAALARPMFAAIRTQWPLLADYAGWYQASIESEAKNFADVPPALDAVFKHSPKSPLRGKASLLAAEAYMKLGRPSDAIRVLREHASETTPPQTEMALADAYLAVGDKVNAALNYQRVYYHFPLSPAGPRALTALAGLKADMGANYPAVSTTTLLTRADLILDASRESEAKAAYTALLPLLRGADLDVARVRIGAATYLAKQDAAAWDYLSKLHVEDDEADAERLYYLTQSARRLGRFDQMDQQALRSSELHRGSPWTVDALIAAGNRHITDHDVAKFEPLYEACYRGAPQDADAHLCHWKVTWLHYMRRSADAVTMLQDHLRAYPSSDEASAAMYFLGRLAHLSGDEAAARSYFSETSTAFPNLFYATLARQRLTALGDVAPSPKVATFLKSVAPPSRTKSGEFTMTPPAKARIERAELLARAGFGDLAEAELRFGADLGEQPQLLGMEIAKLLGSGDPAKALRYVKRYSRGYLLMPMASAPKEFWRLAFPLPYRQPLDRYAQSYGVDPYLMAALIRQESEFNPQAVSVTNARGLSQIEPYTGRDLAARLRVAYSLPKLFQPEYNLQLGTYYVSMLTKQFEGNMEAVLASYNAGPSRAKTWLRWEEYREPAEFIETVPITQTREYIQAVLRNAAAYREIYGPAPAPALKAYK